MADVAARGKERAETPEVAHEVTPADQELAEQIKAKLRGARTMKQASAETRRSVQALHRLYQNGELDAVRVGLKLYVPVAEVIRLLLAGNKV